jgi:thiamine-phosphate pyrophosphorylase
VTRLPRGLYAITPDTDDTRWLLEAVEAAITGGACALQYRNKLARRELQYEQARALKDVCRARGVPLIVNDHLDLMLGVDADGLHLGSSDGSIRHARDRLGSGKLLGASCYNRLDAALEAVRMGADHVAFGSFFPSGSKPTAVQAPASLLREARLRLEVPLVAIGGITTENAPELIAAGADALAIIGALFGAPDPGEAARQFAALFSARNRDPAVHETGRLGAPRLV